MGGCFYMSRWPKKPNKALITKMLQRGAEIGLNIQNACFFARISYAYYKQNKEWTRPAYLAGKALRSSVFLGPSVNACKVIEQKQEAILKKIESDSNYILSEEDFRVIALAHKWAFDEYKRLDSAERRRIERRELKIKEKLLESQLNQKEDINFIPIALPMDSEELSSYIAKDYEHNDPNDSDENGSEQI